MGSNKLIEQPTYLYKIARTHPDLYVRDLRWVLATTIRMATAVAAPNPILSHEDSTNESFSHRNCLQGNEKSSKLFFIIIHKYKLLSHHISWELKFNLNNLRYSKMQPCLYPCKILPVKPVNQFLHRTFRFKVKGGF